MFRRTTLSSSLILAFGGTLLLSAMGVRADDSTQRVEITGSSIKRVDTETSLPVTVMTRDDIARSGVSDLEQLVSHIVSTATAGATRGSDTAGLATYGVSTISLRGLGENRTLVLVNGKRMAPSPNGATTTPVDINSIPLSAIERVEILRDGASATYGSDAVAGVVNFILRKDFHGFEVTAGAGQPTRKGGGKNTNANVLFGFGDLSKDKYNIMLSLATEKETSLAAMDRSFSASGNVPPYFQNAATPSGRVEGIWIPGRTQAQNARVAATNPFGYSSSGYGNPMAPNNCGVINMYPVAAKGGVGGAFNNCNFDSAPYVGLFPTVEHNSLFATWRFQASNELQLYADFMKTRTVTNEAYQPSPERVAFLSTDTAFADPVANPTHVDPALIIFPSNPAYTSVLTPYLLSHGLAGMNGQPVAVSLRTFLTGPRTEQHTNDASRMTLGAQGTAFNWDYDVSGVLSESKVGGSVTDGYFSQLALATIINNPANNWNPWAPGGVQSADLTQKLQAAKYVGPTAIGLSRLSTVDAVLSRSLAELPGGPMQVAAGFSSRHEHYKLDVPAILGAGDIAGLGGATLPVDSTRAVTALFGEASFPVMKNLEIDASARMDHYSDVGSSTNGKVSMKWKPVKSVLLRAAAGSGFRAPTLVELHLPQTVGTSEQFIDPAHTADGDIQVNSIRSGNANLRPEKSNQYSVGLVFEPIPKLSIGIDFFDIKINDYIISPAALGLVRATRAGTPLYGPGDVIFAPDGTVDTVDQTLRNAASAKLQGIDVNVAWQENMPVGKLALELNGTYMSKYDLTTLAGVQHSVGTIIQPDGSPLDIAGIGVVAKWRHTLSATWMFNNFSVTLAQNFYKGYQDHNDLDGNPHRVPDQATYDAQMTYGVLKNLKVSLGLKNMFDKKPPLFIGNGSSFQYGYDPTMSDPRGRIIYAKATMSF